MDPTYSPEAQAFREKIQAFLAEHLPSSWEGIGALDAEAAYEFTNHEWRPLLAEQRYLAPSWPLEYGGGGLSELELVVLAEEFGKAGVPTGGTNDAFSIQMCGNTSLPTSVSRYSPSSSTAKPCPSSGESQSSF